MRVNYKYLKKNDKYYFQRMHIYELKDIDDKWDSVTIIKRNSIYEAEIHDYNYEDIMNYHIPELYFKEATLSELFPHKKPIILSKESKCEYIEKISDKEFNFIINSDGKIIRMNFSGDSILAYFRDLNILYVYGDSKKDNCSSIQTSIYSNFTEKHVIMNNYGIFSEYNNFKDQYENKINSREATFIPLKEGLQELNFSEYNTNDKYDILPYYLRTYFVCTNTKGDNVSLNTLDTRRTNTLQDLIPNMLLLNNTNSKMVILEEEHKKYFDSEEISLSTEIIL